MSGNSYITLDNKYIILQVHIKSQFIMNGVCVRWKGSIDLDRLEGVGCLEYDEEMARREDNERRHFEHRAKTRHGGARNGSIIGQDQKPPSRAGFKVN